MSAKRILVSGATRGLGRSIATLLDRLGHQTFLTGRSQRDLLELQEQLSHAKVLSADLSQRAAVENIVSQAVLELGGLDALINNAGTIDPIATLAESDSQAWARAIDVNLIAPALLMKAALPHLARSGSGRIVNVSTGAALKPMPGWSAYCASKAGLLHLSAVVAAEAPEIACFSLRPGVVDTGMQEAIRSSQGMREADQKKFLDLHSHGGLEPPEVPARAAVWLALEGPARRSGELIEYTDPAVVEGAKALFGQGAP
jgi:NAD(P)-dependent dehydrogenase (short-subunit alcohol dehydrogenase family)